MATFKIRLLRSISHEKEIEIEAPSEEQAKVEAMRQAQFLIWDHRNSAEYEILWIRAKCNDPQETKFG